MPCLRSCLCYGSKVKKVSSDNETTGAQLGCKMSTLMEVIWVCRDMPKITRAHKDSCWQLSSCSCSYDCSHINRKKGVSPGMFYASSLTLLAVSIRSPSLVNLWRRNLHPLSSYPPASLNQYVCDFFLPRSLHPTMVSGSIALFVTFYTLFLENYKAQISTKRKRGEKQKSSEHAINPKRFCVARKSDLELMPLQ